MYVYIYISTSPYNYSHTCIYITCKYQYIIYNYKNVSKISIKIIIKCIYSIVITITIQSGTPDTVNFEDAQIKNYLQLKIGTFQFFLIIGCKNKCALIKIINSN